MEARENDKIITFEQYYDPMLAHIIRTRLEDNGIPCFIADENTLAANPIYNQAVGGIKLKIFERDLARCREILAETGDMHLQDHHEVDDETNTVVTCPYCSSTNVKFMPGRNEKQGWLSSILPNILPSYTTKDWHCYNCTRDFE
ncbi:DUF2007 domain-containing protein [Mucilaginibacter pallidiroseus]|uniref:DUF2007 domain-containing protein n=1 Tax=Mucilaginibacter pallidiroseus TaxID=2599295 RepID=A0A563UJR5_9SPHI|nr:DUF2007 domain-containing protein [Mucilaginibacter pallidiroseus]TWR31614.1 DUF2007 domain-containing protein [Mucilaginibacter pallidiroseus]